MYAINKNSLVIGFMFKWPLGHSSVCYGVDSCAYSSRGKSKVVV